MWCLHGSVNAENFWIWIFTVWLSCLSPKSNLSETFCQVWALHRWGGRQKRRFWYRGVLKLKCSCLLNRCAKNTAFSCSLMTLCQKVIGFVFVGTLYCVPKKVYPLMFDNNFGKCGPIFKILSTADSWENSLCIDTKNSTSPAICCYNTSWKSKIQKCYWFWQHP